MFVNFLGMLESQAERVFIRSKYDKGYKYLNQEGMDAEIQKYGTLLKSPVFKRNCPSPGNSVLAAMAGRAR